MILAGDIGGTKSNLALFEIRAGTLCRIAYRRFASQNYAGAESMVTEFLREAAGSSAEAGRGTLVAAGFGVAGPVIEQCVRATNLPWVVDGAAVARLLGLERVLLLNDLEATAYSLNLLQPGDFCVLNTGTPAPTGNKALIAAGTGLGEAIMFWDGKQHVVAATEGGHADFAPHTETEIELLRYLKRQRKDVCCELILSGRGFRLIHEFLDLLVRHPSFDNPEQDPAPEITRLAFAGACCVCTQTLDLWTAAYGAETGNLALRALARGGVYVAGGIAVKILPKLKDGTFVRAFRQKSIFGALLEQIPIHVVANEDAPLLGVAARVAQLSGL